MTDVGIVAQPPRCFDDALGNLLCGVGIVL
jgi:hypothetical protein